MPFVNGIATGEDIKEPLWAIDPAQISDLLIADGINQGLLSGLFLINTRNGIFGVTPGFLRNKILLQVQRYNNLGYSFAEQYSIKIFNFLKKYARTQYLHSRLFMENFAPPPDLDSFFFNAFSDIPTYQNIDIQLPDNGLEITITYFNQVLDESEGFYIRLVDFDCLKSEYGRRLDIAGQNYICNGQTITIDFQNIALYSVVIDFLSPEFTAVEQEDIINQIPDGYSYLDMDQWLVDLSAIIDGVLPNYYDPNGVPLNVQYSIDWVVIYTSNNSSFKNTFEYLAGTLEHDQLNEIDSDYYLATLLIGNNNNWNNYNFNYPDLGKPAYITRTGNEFIELYSLTNNTPIYSNIRDYDGLQVEVEEQYTYSQNYTLEDISDNFRLDRVLAK